MIQIEELNRQLHDARIHHSDISLNSGTLSIRGEIEMPYREGRLPRLGRFDFLLSLSPVSDVEVSDPERIRMIILQDIYINDNGQLVLGGATPGSIRVVGQDLTASLTVEQHPSALRRWWVWRPTGPA
jgi:hypothetical protein